MGRVVGYLVRSLASIDPGLVIYPTATRLTNAPLLKHLSVPLGLVRFICALQLRQIELVHINVAPRGSTWRKMLYAAAARGLRRTTIIHLHGSAYDEYFRSLRPFQARLIRHFFQSADHVVALSDEWLEFVRKELHVPDIRTSEIANGVPPAGNLQPRSGQGPVRIAFFGIVGRRKGTDILIKALASLASRGRDFQAIIGGDGEVEAAREHAKQLGIADRIEFLGWVDESTVDQELRKAHIFVLPSRAENQPVAILEAMARALPVVATRIGAIPQQVEDGVTGLLVELGDVEGLAASLAELIDDEARRKAMGQAGLEAFEQRFSIDACARKFAALYRRLSS